MFAYVKCSLHFYGSAKTTHQRRKKKHFSNTSFVSRDKWCAQNFVRVFSVHIRIARMWRAFYEECGKDRTHSHSMQYIRLLNGHMCIAWDFMNIEGQSPTTRIVHETKWMRPYYGADEMPASIKSVICAKEIGRHQWNLSYIDCSADVNVNCAFFFFSPSAVVWPEVKGRNTAVVEARNERRKKRIYGRTKWWWRYVLFAVIIIIIGRSNRTHGY